MHFSKIIGILSIIVFASPITLAASNSKSSKNSQGILNKLLAPGPLSAPHKDLEHASCLSCHAAANGVPDKKCLDCHKDIRRSIEKPKSFHKLTQKPCLSCHSEHKGRDYDSAIIDKLTFDHSKTGSPLSKPHAKLACEECHKNKRTDKALRPEDTHYFGPTPSCNSCHNKDDPHQFTGKFQSTDCSQCHRDDSWKVNGIYDSIKPNKLPPPPHFFHNIETKYRVDGKHLDVRCNECHVKVDPSDTRGNATRQYSWPDLNQKTCESCHKNPHIGKFPPTLMNRKCNECHITSSWTKLPQLEKNFDHNNLTRFELTGRHQDITCAACHLRDGRDVYKFQNASSGFCTSCHKNIHSDQFRPDYRSEACLTCHDTTSFTKLKPFNHDTETHFRLTGDHLRIKNQCTKCHTPTSRILSEKPRKFAGKFIFANRENGYCTECHTNVHLDQFHQKYREQACSQCHTTDTFLTRLPFDHASTGYTITGKHANLECRECHKPTSVKFPSPLPRYKSQFMFPDLANRNCATCHKDPHNGKLGSRCINCHSEQHAWSSIDDFHKNYLLVGAHNLLSCEQCHGPDNHRRLTGASERCVFCHKKDDHHNGGLPECAQCHTQQNWQILNFSHSLTQFPLTGAHRSATCNACHKRGIYEGTPYDCQSCHARDAQGVSFPNHALAGFEDCGSCHNPFSFKSGRR